VSNPSETRVSVIGCCGWSSTGYVPPTRRHRPASRRRSLLSLVDAADMLGLVTLRRGFSVEEAQRQLDIAIDWGRYGELLDYDSVSDEITADPAAGIHPGIASPANRATGAAQQPN
jgi:hypothetical protein